MTSTRGIVKTTPGQRVDAWQEYAHCHAWPDGMDQQMACHHLIDSVGRERGVDQILETAIKLKGEVDRQTTSSLGVQDSTSAADHALTWILGHEQDRRLRV